MMVSMASSINVQAQSADALLKKLVEKGILTKNEADDLRKQSDQEFTKSFQVKTGLPDWVTSLKFNGDFRARYEGHYADNDNFVERHRFRYRLRFGVLATLKDDFDIGFRLASGDPVSGFSNNAGNPLSGSTTLQDNATRKFLYLDLAYARWNFVHSAEMAGSVTFGKMDQPFVFSHVVFDPDYNPEGLAANLAYHLSDQHTVKGTIGGFVLDELSASSHDPYLLGAQLRLDSKWTPKISTSLGFAALGIVRDESLNNSNVPNVNRGNTRDATGAPEADFEPIVVDASVTYMLDSFPLYAGPFPIKVGAEYMYNPGADDRNQAFGPGINFGKTGKKGQWEFSYQYRYIGGDSWYEELPDDDFGAFYQVQQANAGFTSPGAGFGGGTNLRGHVGKLYYSVTDSLLIGATYYRGDLITSSPAGASSIATHLLADLIWKF
jgi:hypothetical protein